MSSKSNPRHYPAALTSRLSSVAYVVVGTALALMALAPIIYIVIRSFLPASADVDGLGVGTIASLTSENYELIFSSGVGVVQYATNSAILAMSCAVLVAVISTLAGYSLARFSSRGTDIVFIILLAPLVVPFQGLLPPISIVLGKLGLLDSLLGVILVIVTLQIPFATFVMRNTFEGLPIEIEESAQIDGAGIGRRLWSVMLPLVWPGIITVFLFGFMAGWNDLLGSVVFLSTPAKYTLPIALTTITTSLQLPGIQIVDPGLLTATACVATIPVIALFLSLQRYYTRGLIGGSIK